MEDLKDLIKAFVVATVILVGAALLTGWVLEKSKEEYKKIYIQSYGQ